MCGGGFCLYQGSGGVVGQAQQDRAGPEVEVRMALAGALPVEQPDALAVPLRVHRVDVHVAEHAARIGGDGGGCGGEPGVGGGRPRGEPGAAALRVPHVARGGEDVLAGGERGIDVFGSGFGFVHGWSPFGFFFRVFGFFSSFFAVSSSSIIASRSA